MGSRDAAAGERKKKPNRLRWVFTRAVIYLIVIPYITVAVVVFFMQDQLLFYSEGTHVSEQWIERTVERDGAERLMVRAEDGTELRGLFLPATVDEGADAATVVPRPTVLYFGGNAESVERGSGDHGALRSRGWNVVLLAYRGYGRSGGEPGAREILGDALVVYDTIAARQDVDGAHIATWGRSLGTGVATHVAANRPVCGVVLVSSYARLSESAAVHYPWLPVKLLFGNEIDSLAVAPSIDTPALFFHGALDRVIPYEQSVKLQEAWRPRPRLVTLPGRDHNDVDMDPSYPAEAVAFLESLR